MRTDPTEQPQTLEGFREYLAVLAHMHMNSRNAGKIDLSGVIQQTLLEAYQALERQQGPDPVQRAAWLRRILANNLADEFRKQTTRKRDRTLERSLGDMLDESACRFESLLAVNQSSPSQKAIRQEEMIALAAALASLPENQRRAVELHHLNGWPLAKVAEELSCSKAAVAGLLHRGLRALRTRLEQGAEQ